MISILLCHADEDDALRQELEKHLLTLQKRDLITIWHNRNIAAGTEWEREIDKHLNTAQIILLLISPDFLASDYWCKIEQRAIERHERDEACVIPVILRHVAWQDGSIGKLKALPTGAIPVVSHTWHNLDEAFYNIVDGLREVVLKLTSPPPLVTSDLPQNILDKASTMKRGGERSNQGPFIDPLAECSASNKMASPTLQPHTHKNASDWLQESYRLRKLGQYDGALNACKQLLALDPTNAQGYANLSFALHGLERYNEALDACERALALNAGNPRIYTNKANILNNLERYKEALDASDQAIKLDPSSPHPYLIKSSALCTFERYEEALTASKKALQLDPSHVDAYTSVSYALIKLKNYSDAIDVCNQALQLNPSNQHAQSYKQYALKKLGQNTKKH